MLAHDREQIAEPRLHRRELGRAIRQRGGKLREPVSFEGRPYQDRTVRLERPLERHLLVGPRGGPTRRVG